MPGIDAAGYGTAKAWLKNTRWRGHGTGYFRTVCNEATNAQPNHTWLARQVNHISKKKVDCVSRKIKYDRSWRLLISIICGSGNGHRLSFPLFHSKPGYVVLALYPVESTKMNRRKRTKSIFHLERCAEWAASCINGQSTCGRRGALISKNECEIAVSVIDSFIRATGGYLIPHFRRNVPVIRDIDQKTASISRICTTTNKIEIEWLNIRVFIDSIHKRTDDIPDTLRPAIDRPSFQTVDPIQCYPGGCRRCVYCTVTL